MAVFAKTAIVCSPPCSASCMLLVALDCVDCRNNVACNRQPGRWCSQGQKFGKSHPSARLVALPSRSNILAIRSRFRRFFFSGSSSPLLVSSSEEKSSSWTSLDILVESWTAQMISRLEEQIHQFQFFMKDYMNGTTSMPKSNELKQSRSSGIRIINQLP